MTDVPFFEWLVNILLCLTTLLVVSVSTRVLEHRRLWTPTMTLGCFLKLVFLRFQIPYLGLIPLVLFGLGIYEALGTRPLEENVRIGLAAFGALVWFGFIFWKIVMVIFYFCAGCLF
jgi:hypothetical protein